MHSALGMDDRCMAGNLSETRMRAIVQTQQFDLRKEIEEIKTLLTKQAQAATESSNKERAGANDEWNRWVVVGGFFRRIPFDWVFPSGPVLNVYQYWHHGDENKKISPRKKSTRADLSWCKVWDPPSQQGSDSSLHIALKLKFVLLGISAKDLFF